MLKSITVPVKNQYHKIAPAIPAIAFFGGFLWDAITLGFKINSSDLYIVLGYLLGAYGCQILMGREIKFKYSEYLSVVFQFFLGGVFSALVIFYFKSSAQFFSYLTVFLIAGLLVLNEFISSHYTKQNVSWLMLSVCSTMFFNFFLPHLFGSIAAIWFYVSIFFTLVLTTYTAKFIGKPLRWLPLFSIQIILLLLFILNWIPPVPLVQKNLVISHHIHKSKGDYFSLAPVIPWYLKVITWNKTLLIKPGSDIYCFSSVFAPEGIEAKIYHHWEYYNKINSHWESRDRIGFNIKSGRLSGYRGYTFKKNLSSGLWRIKVETENGRVMGKQKFYLKVDTRDSAPTMEQIILN